MLLTILVAFQAGGAYARCLNALQIYSRIITRLLQALHISKTFPIFTIFNTFIAANLATPTEGGTGEGREGRES